MRALRLAAYELLRFRTPMQRAGLGFLLLVPLLYGGIYLWSNWDPYSKIDQVPVAVVNEDEPVEVEDRTVNAGGDFVTELRREPLLGWRFTSAPEAADGLRDGRYYAVITVPRDFSAKLTSGATGSPRRAAMEIRLDDANNFLVGIMAETIQSELQRQISAAAVSAYFQAAFGQLDELHQGITEAADGAGRLRDGLGRAKDGSSRLAGGLEQARTGTAALAGGLGQAKSGSAALVNGLEQARTGTAALAGGLGRAKSGSAALVDGLTAADRGAGTLANGLTTLQRGTARLAPGAEQVSQGVHRVTGTAVPLLDRASRALPDLTSLAAALTTEAAGVTATTAAVADRAVHDTRAVRRWMRGVVAARPAIAGSTEYRALDASLTWVDGHTETRVWALANAFPEAADRHDLPTAVTSARRLDRTLLARLNLLAERYPVLRDDPLFRETLEVTELVAEGVRRVARRADRADAVAQRIAADVGRFQRRVPGLRERLAEASRDLRTLDRGAARVAAGARRLDAGATRLAGGADQLHSGTTRLLAGARRLDAGNAELLSGARALNAGGGKLLSGARRLDAGNAELLAGARQVDDGAGRLLSGARELDSGNARLLGGSRKLASGLKSAEDRIPTVEDPADTAEKLANPVDVRTTNAHPAKYYGRGLAPFFIAIALWVFGIVAFLMLRPVSGRLLASRAGSVTVAFAAWLPVLFMGALAALVLFGALTVALGLNPVNAAGTVLLMLLGVAAFSAIVHVLRLAFGAVGDALALVMLMVQLVSCGGLYPVETLPQPFRAIHDVVPMTYFVAPMRATISGGQTSHVVADALVLTGYLAGALALLVLAVHLQRRWSMARLKPELEL
ncbi:YhgE/Pip family protein [Actinomadura kijaniata]|uniref:YhgE/Pip family protein n=1 Tax=Actinomadura kijaniata TaxID=46161 RepID=UPI003F1B8FBE